MHYPRWTSLKTLDRLALALTACLCAGHAQAEGCVRSSVITCSEKRPSYSTLSLPFSPAHAARRRLTRAAAALAGRTHGALAQRAQAGADTARGHAPVQERQGTGVRGRTPPGAPGGRLPRSWAVSVTRPPARRSRTWHRFLPGPSSRLQSAALRPDPCGEALSAAGTRRRAAALSYPCAVGLASSRGGFRHSISAHGGGVR